MLSEHNALQSINNVHFQTWSGDSGRFRLQTITESATEFVENLANDIWNLTKHHFTARSQSTFLHDSKQLLDEKSCIILMDFAENYTFIAQESVQSFYWSNTQATLHPFVIYYKTSSPETEIKCLSICVISENLQHVTTTVHTFHSKVLSLLKAELPWIEKVMYVSDGASSQYKNK